VGEVAPEFEGKTGHVSRRRPSGAGFSRAPEHRAFEGSKGFFDDHDVQERMTKESGLDFVIARPTRLTNGPARGKYVKTSEIVSVPGSISRADVADFMVEACESTTWVGKGVQLGG
jgi:uncharacterized protein YbjT (DUF2867 family)